MHNLSDEALCDPGGERVFSIFCGEVVFSTRRRLTARRSRWRQRLGEEQIAALLQELSVAHRAGAIEPRIWNGLWWTPPAGESGRASDRRPARPPGNRETGRSGQARGRQAAPELSASGQAPAIIVGAIPIHLQARPAGAQIPAHPARPHHPGHSPPDRRRPRARAAFARFDLALRVRHQEQRQRGPEVYSLAPEVECIGKGKARTPYGSAARSRSSPRSPHPKAGSSCCTPRRCMATRMTIRSVPSSPV